MHRSRPRKTFPKTLRKSLFEADIHNMNDYLELNMYLDEAGEDTPVFSLYAHTVDRKLLYFEAVRENPIRYQGSWSINHKHVGLDAISYIIADQITHFTVIEEQGGQRLTVPHAEVNNLESESLDLDDLGQGSRVKSFPTNS